MSESGLDKMRGRVNISPPDTKTTSRVTIRLDNTLIDAAQRAMKKVKPKKTESYWLTRWCAIGAVMDGAALYDIDGVWKAEVLVDGVQTPCVVLARGPEHVTVGIDGDVRTVAPELVRRVEG